MMKVLIESKAAIKEAIDYIVKQDILEPQIEPTPCVFSVIYPDKPTGEVRPCLETGDLNKTIIWENHKPQTVEEIAHQLAGEWSSQRQMPSRPFYRYTSPRQAANCWSSTPTKAGTSSSDAIWSQNVLGCVSDENGPHHGKVPRSDKHS